jgi:hypothetical protein
VQIRLGQIFVADGAIEALIVALTAEKYLFIPEQRNPYKRLVF